MFLGIDASLRRTGICFSNGAKHETFSLPTPEDLRGPARLDWLVNNFRDTCGQRLDTVTQAAIEGYAMGAKGRVFDIAEWGGVLRLILYRAKVPLIVIAPSTAKKYLSAGNMEKNQVLLEVYKQYGVSCATDDEADALVMADMARQHYLRPAGLPKRQLEALQKAEILIPNNKTKAARISRDR